MRAHCVNTAHGDLWLSQSLPAEGEHGVTLTLDATGMAGEAWDLGEYEVCLLLDACRAFLLEHGITDRAKDSAHA